MASETKLTEKAYFLRKRQRLQVDGVVRWYEVGTRVNPAWFPRVLLERLVRLKFVEEKEVPIPASTGSEEKPPAPPKPKPAAAAPPPVAAAKKG